MSIDIDSAATHILAHCGDLKPGETVAVVFDDRTAALAEHFRRAAVKLGADDALAATIGRTADMHGAEPPAAVANAMRKADLVVGLTWMSMAHTQARLSATEAGGRYLSLPQYDAAMILHPAVAVDYRSLSAAPRKIADALSAGKSARIVTPGGSDVAFDISGRNANFCPGYLDPACRLASPPDIEVNVSPRESATSGIFAVDGSVALEEIGKIEDPFFMRIEGGRCVDIHGPDASMVDAIKRIFLTANDDKAAIVGELGIGFNPLATPCGCMLLDEGAAGCVHLGFGSNSTVGGENVVAFHLDFVARELSLFIDGVPYMRDGIVL